MKKNRVENENNISKTARVILIIIAAFVFTFGMFLNLLFPQYAGSDVLLIIRIGIVVLAAIIVEVCFTRKTRLAAQDNIKTWEEQQKEEKKDKKIDKEKIGLLIKEKRIEKKYTQKELAEALSISDKAISKWERGLALPDKGIVHDLSEILDIPEIYLFSGGMEAPSEPRKSDSKKALIIGVIIVVIIASFAPDLIYRLPLDRTAYNKLTSVMLSEGYMENAEGFYYGEDNREDISNEVNRTIHKINRIIDYADRKKDSTAYKKVKLEAYKLSEDISQMDYDFFWKPSDGEGLNEEEKTNFSKACKNILADYENLGEAIIEAGKYEKESFDNKELIELWKEKINRW